LNKEGHVHRFAIRGEKEKEKRDREKKHDRKSVKAKV
jgi:hypothetical protein